MPDLTPERWPHIEALLDRAFDLPPAERTALLEAAEADDPDLIREVRALLHAGDRAHALLEDSGLLLRWQRGLPATGAEGPLREGPDAADEDLTGRAVGRYRLLEEIGRGGMGTVYRAERADGAFEHTVALKLIRPGMGSAAVLRRFRHERQVLASLDHPNVARILDGGRADDGRPYLVMELVDGEPITAYCNRRRLGVEARLRLFRQVCDAVAYAHRRLVVHRDLKPSNVLVAEDEQGRPHVKLLDFGIAKLMHPAEAGLFSGEAGSEATLTRDGRLPLTPQYAAPEQVRGEAITTATDVYALGVLLYELLTGQPPYRLDASRPAEWERVIGGVEPQRPSAAAPQGEAESHGGEPLKKRLAGDLDTICLKALRKEPERRYPSPEALGADLERHLGGLPVEARPDTLAYRARKFVGRHRRAVAATAAVVVAFLALVGFYTQRLATERDRAEQEATTAEQVTAFLVDVFQSSDPFIVGGQEVTARELLDRGVERIDGLGDEPAVQAVLLSVFGNIYHRLGLYDDARPLLERALTRYREVWGPTHERTALGLSELAGLLIDVGELDEAERLLREALAIDRRLDSDDPSGVVRRLNNLASVLWNKGAYAEAEPLYRDALAVRRRLHDGPHPDVALSLNNLASVLQDLGAYAEAESLYREALAMWRQLHGDEHPYIAGTLGNLAGLLVERRAYAEAEPLLREVLAMWRRLLGDEHPDVAVSLNNLAGLLDSVGKETEAEALYRESLAMRRRLLGDEHPYVMQSLINLAGVVYDQDRYEEAETHLTEALAMRGVLNEGHPFTGIGLAMMGRLLTKTDRPEKAESLLREALAIAKETRGDEHVRTARMKLALGTTLTALGRYGEAEPYLTQASTVFQSDDPTVLSTDREDVGLALVEMYTAWGKPAEAARYR